MRLLSVGRYLFAGFGVLSLAKNIVGKKNTSKKELSEDFGMETFNPNHEWIFKGEAKDLMTTYMQMNSLMESKKYISARDLVECAMKNRLVSTDDISLSVLMHTEIDKYGWTSDEWDPQFKNYSEEDVALYYGKPYYLIESRKKQAV